MRGLVLALILVHGTPSKVSVECSTENGVQVCRHKHDWSDWATTGAACQIQGKGPGTKHQRKCSSCGVDDKMCM